MSFITYCLDIHKKPVVLRESGDIPFVDFLQSHKMTPLLQHFVLNSVAMLNPDATTAEAFVAISKFITSAGKYGNTPFLYPAYGNGEIPQAFCR